MADLAFVGAHGSASNNAATSITTSATRSLTTGNHNFVWVTWYVANTTVTVTDTAGNTYTPLTRINHAAGQLYGQWFYCLNATGHAANHVTATFAVMDTASFITLRVIELSGSAPTVSQHDAIDQDAASSGAVVSILDPGVSAGPGSALLSGVNSYNGLTGYTFSAPDNVYTPSWTEVVSHVNYGGAGYALYPSGVANAAPRVTGASNSQYWLLVTLVLSLGSVLAQDTKARVSQVVAETLRTNNNNPNVRTSQVVAEVLRINTSTMIRASQVVAEVLRPNAALANNARPVIFIST